MLLSLGCWYPLVTMVNARAGGSKQRHKPADEGDEGSEAGRPFSETAAARQREDQAQEPPPSAAAAAAGPLSSTSMPLVRATADLPDISKRIVSRAKRRRLISASSAQDAPSNLQASEEIRDHATDQEDPLPPVGRGFPLPPLLIRRTKDTTPEIDDLSSQLQLLAHIPVDPLVRSHIMLKLRKVPSLRGLDLSSLAALLVADSPRGSDEKLRVRVENRLCSSKGVAEGVKAAIAWVVGQDGARLPSKRSRTERGKLQSKDGEASKGRGMAAVYDEDIPNDADGWESGSISPDETAPKHPKRAPNTSKRPDQPESEASSEDETAIVLAPPSKRVKAAPSQQRFDASSHFLPALSTGFVSGDFSDPDDDTGANGEVGKGSLRKNRRGQRARQA